MIQFERTSEATVCASRVCQQAGARVSTVNSRRLIENNLFRTRVVLAVFSEELVALAVNALRSMGFANIEVDNGPLKMIEAYSSVIGHSTDMVAEQARRALVDRLGDSFDANEVSAMPDHEVLEIAASNGLVVP